jgi:Protein of unknown function (DUF1488)
MARFLMNAMLSSGGYPWTVIRLPDRKAYLAALDRASIEADITPFTTLLAQRVIWVLKKHVLEFPDTTEKFVLHREVVLFYGQAGEKRVPCAISREALDDDFQAHGRDKVEVSRENRKLIEEWARQKYAAGDTEPDGSILVRTGELARRKNARR